MDQAASPASGKSQYTHSARGQSAEHLTQHQWQHQQSSNFDHSMEASSSVLYQTQNLADSMLLGT